MRAIRLRAPGGPEELVLEQLQVPAARAGEVLVRVHAAAITRDELEWTEDRLPATPSYELSGVVEDVAPGIDVVSVGQPVFALTPFDRDGVAADYAVVPADLLVSKPRTLDHVESAAVPLPALSAWQGLFVHGGLEPGGRVLVNGAGGGVGHLAVQLARRAGAYVIGTASARSAESARSWGADEVIDSSDDRFDQIEPVDVVFDTVGGELLSRSTAIVARRGTIVSIAEEPPEGVEATYFIVEPNREQLLEIARVIDGGELRPSIDSVFPLADARAAFERSMAEGKRGKVVLRIVDD
jgi:NADPH:quinone reductase-like Zn-dependent oxidoreductase